MERGVPSTGNSMWARERHGGRESRVHSRLCTSDVVSGILLEKRQGDMRVRPAGSACCAQAVWLLMAFCRSVMETDTPLQGGGGGEAGGGDLQGPLRWPQQEMMRPWWWRLWGSPGFVSPRRKRSEGTPSTHSIFPVSSEEILYPSQSISCCFMANLCIPIPSSSVVGAWESGAVSAGFKPQPYHL